MPNCKACAAEIRFARTEHDKTMPVDAEPSQDGNLVLYRHDGILRARSASLPSDQLRPRHKSHFASCPNAGEFRKKAAA